MDVEAQIEALNTALRLQHRSALQYTLTAGSMFGFEYQSLAGFLGAFAVAEIAPPRFVKDPHEAVAWLIESEAEILQKLQDAIEPTGREAASEAIEHRLEHIIMRKQEQVDVLLRAVKT